jgi:adenylylsulfate kinase
VTVAWFTGLPSSGKSTLARAVAEALRQKRRAVIVLDGDELRAAMSPSPGYDETGRAGFYRTLGNLATLFAAQGLIVLVAATGHQRRFRDEVRASVARFVEIFVDTPLATCARRDAKGLYAVAERGGAPTLPGASLAYEPPLQPEIVVHPDDAHTVDHIAEVLSIP